MQIVVDLPEPLYQKLMQIAATDGITVEEELVMQAETLSLQTAPTPAPDYEISHDNPRRLPRIQPKVPGTLPCGSENLNDYIFA